MGSAAGWVREAREQLEELANKARAAAGWEEIRGTENEEDLGKYVEEFRGQLGTAAFVRQAESRLAELHQNAAKMAEAARIAFEEARGTGTVAALVEFMKMHETVAGTADLMREARDRMEELRSGQTREAVAAMEFVWIPAGEFRMGSKVWTNEGPVRRVDISEGFWLGKYEVTQGQWAAVMGSNPSWFEKCGRDCPVEDVSWEDVQEFIGKLNALEKGQKYRLPTESEWGVRGAGRKSEGHLRGEPKGA